MADDEIERSIYFYSYMSERDKEARRAFMKEAKCKGTIAGKDVPPFAYANATPKDDPWHNGTTMKGDGSS